MAYAAKDITVLKGLEPVRQRPGMYIGSTGPTGLHHLVYEIVDNSVDEAMAGYCTRIDVTLLADGGCRVSDDGRGMPVDNHPEYKGKSAAEVIMTVLHAGGKFGGEGYKISGGLHGVGVSVVNALSSRLDVEIHRDGGKWEQHFAKGGKPQDKLTRTAASKKHGTTISFWPDATIFEETEFRAQTLIERLREMAFLSKGLEIRFRDERVDPVLAVDFKFNGGISDFVKHLNSTKEPLFKRVIAYTEEGADYEVDVAMQWNTGFYEGIHSFANNIATTEGGMHEEGFKKSLTNVINRYAKAKNLIKEKDPNLLGEDIREGLTAILSVKLRNPQFEGQTKAKLGNTEMRSLVEKATNEKLADWLEEHPSEARQAVAKSNQAAKARMAARQARDLTRRKSLLESSAMPGKLADCSSKDPDALRALHRRGRQRRRAAPSAPATRRSRRSCRSGGRSSTSSGRASTGCSRTRRSRRSSPRCGTGIGDEFDIAKLRYHKIVLMTDADVDGSHIRTLAAHVLLPAVPGDGARRSRVHRAAAAVPRRHRQGTQLPEGRSRAARLRRGRTPTARSRSAGSRVSVRWTGRSSASPPWIRRRARCCRCRWRTPPSPTTCSRDSWVTTSNPARRSSRRTRKTCASSTSELAAPPIVLQVLHR